MSVLAVMRSLRSEVDAGSVRPYCFVDINGLKLPSPETIYRVNINNGPCFLFEIAFSSCYIVYSIFFQVIYEALSGHRVSWKKALQSLNERFSDGKKIGKEDDRPCILLIDELDLLVTRNQSVTCLFCDLKICQ